MERTKSQELPGRDRPDLWLPGGRRQDLPDPGANRRRSNRSVLSSQRKKLTDNCCHWASSVGATGFEPATSRSRSDHHPAV